MRKIKSRQSFFVAKRWFVVLLCLSFVFCCCFISVKPFVFTYAKSEAETIILNSANQAVLNVLNKNKISYSDISKISRGDDNTVKGIEIDIENINRLKSEISNEISNIISKNNKYDLYIPVGTLFGMNTPRVTDLKLSLKCNLPKRQYLILKVNLYLPE